MTETTATETPRYAVAFDADKGIVPTRVKTERHALFVQDKGIPLFATEELAQAAVEQVTALGEAATWTKKAQVVVNGMVVWTGNTVLDSPKAETPAGESLDDAKARVRAASKKVAAEQPDLTPGSPEHADAVITETAKERKNRLARERRAAKKADQA